MILTIPYTIDQSFVWVSGKVNLSRGILICPIGNVLHEREDELGRIEAVIFGIVFQLLSDLTYDRIVFGHIRGVVVGLGLVTVITIGCDGIFTFIVHSVFELYGYTHEYDTL